jgi:DnaJ-class molecular chaperone
MPPDDLFSSLPEPLPCPTCSGRGILPATDGGVRPCPGCGGTGVKMEREETKDE